ncbi:MAG TPA: hypothetical protein VFE53_06230, partial [Mucilaginibacter sp.]|nr:hypothetical protein [Mucilaginibacter sp.]
GVCFDFSYNDQKYIFTLTEINPGDTTVWLSGDGFSLIECVLYSGNQQFELYQENAPIIPAIVIEGKTYANVNLTSNGANAYYWAKGIGLIKRRETNGTVINTYTLLRNN